MPENRVSTTKSPEAGAFSVTAAKSTRFGSRMIIASACTFRSLSAAAGALDASAASALMYVRLT